MKNSKDYEREINYLYDLKIELNSIINENRIILDEYDEDERKYILNENKYHLEFMMKIYFKYFEENIEYQYSEEFIESQFDEIINESSFLNEIEYI